MLFAAHCNSLHPYSWGHVNYTRGLSLKHSVEKWRGSELGSARYTPICNLIQCDLLSRQLFTISATHRHWHDLNGDQQLRREGYGAAVIIIGAEQGRSNFSQLLGMSRGSFWPWSQSNPLILGMCRYQVASNTYIYLNDVLLCWSCWNNSVLCVVVWVELLLPHKQEQTNPTAAKQLSFGLPSSYSQN